MSKEVAVIMDSGSDLNTMCPCIQRLKSFGIPTEVHVISAYRTPAVAERFASQVRKNGFSAIIAAVGRAAHLTGTPIAYTTLPAIGTPIKAPMMGGLDSLLSMVQMPKGIPVACVAMDGADNAAILVAQMLVLSDEVLSNRLMQLKVGMTAKVKAKDHKIQMEEL